MRVLPMAVSVVFALMSVSAARAADTLEEILEPIRTKYDLPALSAAVARDGTIVARGVVGVRMYQSTIKATVDDRFHLGSDTKAMTATLAAMLIEDGKLSWTSTVGEVLGSRIPNLKPGVAAITLETLLSHTSGLPFDTEEIATLYFMAPSPDLSLTSARLKLIETWGTKNELTGEPPYKFQYSNLGYIIAGAMIEAASGQAWEQMITDRIFEPLGLRSAGLGPQATTGRIDAAVGHHVDEKGTITPRAWGPWADSPAVLGPAGTAHMNVSDFVTWGAWNAGGGKRGPHLVKPESLKRLQGQRIETEVPDPKPGTPKSGGYAMGWGLMQFAWTKAPVLTHNGSNSMNFATIVVDVQNDLAIAVLTNFPGKTADVAATEVAGALYRKYVGTGRPGRK